MVKKTRIVIFYLLLTTTLSLTSCETLARAFADQAGRNAADALESVEKLDFGLSYYPLRKFCCKAEGFLEKLTGLRTQFRA